MMKNKHKGKKRLTAVSAVVAAGLTPGFVTATPSYSPTPEPNAAITAAEVVAIDGNTYSFDELYAMQQPDYIQRYEDLARNQPQHATRYGAPCGSNQHVTMYGVPRPSIPYPSRPSAPKPEPPVVIVTLPNSETVTMSCLEYLMEYTAQLIDADNRGILFSPDSDLTQEIGMDEEQLKELKAEIKDCFGVEVSHHRFRLKGQLNTLRLISDYIIKLKALWD